MSRDSSCGPSRHNQWRNSCLWHPNIPPEGLLFNGSEGDQPPDRFDLPVTTLLFGGLDGRYSSLVEIVVWTFDISYITGIEFSFTDVSQNGHLGHIGPFDDTYPLPRKFDNSQDHRISISIDGPGGEELRSIEVQEKGGYLAGLKIRTNFDREVTSPQHPFTIGKKWTTVQPAGSKIVGLFCRHGRILWSLGLISTVPGIDDTPVQAIIFDGIGK